MLREDVVEDRVLRVRREPAFGDPSGFAFIEQRLKNAMRRCVVFVA